MDPGPAHLDAATIARAQQLRLGRILRGAIAFGCTAVIVVGCWMLGYLDGVRVVQYLIAVIGINVVALTLLLTNINLRFRDPSMTVPLILASLWPSVYVMYYVTEPMIRAAFLLMGTVGTLFGALALDYRRMLSLGGLVLIPYLVLLAVLYHTAPERLDLRVEVMMVLAYAIVLVQISSLGSFIGGLRMKLRERNASLTRTMAELEDLATRDPLTRLPNRRTAMARLEQALGDAERRNRDGGGLCVALLDVDLFKRVNDRFGHQTGDEVLRRVGAALSGAMREGDFVARFGGEEFLVILPNTSREGGAAVAERIRHAVEHMCLEALPAVTTTVSIGVALHDVERRIEDTLGRADEALYQAKRLGRNRVVVWREPATAAQAPAS